MLFIFSDFVAISIKIAYFLENMKRFVLQILKINCFINLIFIALTPFHQYLQVTFILIFHEIILVCYPVKSQCIEIKHLFMSGII